VNETLLDELTSNFVGEVILPSSPQYDDFRNAFNKTGSPAVIVRCQTNDDVIKAIQFARENQLTLAVRSGGHSPSGLSTNDGGLVIDLSPMNEVKVLDSAQHLVRIQAGAKWGAAAAALAEHGLAISSGDTNSVGVGGLTLGGGIGWLVRKYGLTIDHLQAAEIITADGRTLRAGAEENPDLFWAIRGGGGNFGVVTSFDFRAYPISSVVGGLITYDMGEIGSVLAKWTEAMRHAPEELSSTLAIFSGFGPEVPPAIFVFACYGANDEAAANAAIKPLLELGKVTSQDIKTMPYYKMLEDALMPGHLKALSHSGFVKTLNGDVLEALATNYGRPGTAIIQVRSLGGAVARVAPEDTAFAHRDYEAFILAASLVPKDMPQTQADQVMKQNWAPLRPFVSGAYINFMSGQSDSDIDTAYPSATYARLASIKADYDPHNVFNQNLNIKPA
jgi:FAD/FMN-containing dehydrogenase